MLPGGPVSHDSRYEKECPQHGWYLDEEGCAGCRALEPEPWPDWMVRHEIETALDELKGGQVERAVMILTLLKDGNWPP